MKRLFSRSVLPLAAFAVVLGVHFVWQGSFPEQDPVQRQWAAAPAPSGSSWLRRYIETGGYWSGYSYALALAFAFGALRRHREQQCRRAKGLAVGGATLAGFLAVVGCYLVGCCGSPMLIVYLNLFGAVFLPLAKPLMAGITTMSIALAWWWMMRRVQKTSGP